MVMSKLRQYARQLPQRFSFKRTLFGVLLIALCGALVASRPPTALEQVLASGTLVAISRNGPTTYYEGPNGTTGFEYALLQGFADSLGVTLEIRRRRTDNHPTTATAGSVYLALPGGHPTAYLQSRRR